MPHQEADGGHTVARLGKIGKLTNLSPKQQPFAMSLKNCKANDKMYKSDCFDTRESFPPPKSQFRKYRKAFGMTSLHRVIITYIGFFFFFFFGVIEQGSVDILAYCCVNLMSLVSKT